MRWVLAVALIVLADLATAQPRSINNPLFSDGTKATTGGGFFSPTINNPKLVAVTIPARNGAVSVSLPVTMFVSGTTTRQTIAGPHDYVNE